MHTRVAIIGNAGSGKSYLAAAMARAWSLPVIDLDDIFWMPGGYIEKRPAEAVLAEIGRRQAEPRWIVEGVYGELIEPILDRTSFLVWLDIDWPTCLATIENRHRRAVGPARDDSAGSYAALVAYAGDYWTREGPRSRRGHQALFDDFPRTKQCFRTRDDVAAFIRTI